MEIFIISSGMLAVALCLNLIGSVLKYRTGTPNELIAFILTAISFLIWCLIGAWKSVGICYGSAFWFEVLFSNGFSLGLPTAGLAITGWDILHGIHRFRKNRRAGNGKEKAAK